MGLPLVEFPRNGSSTTGVVLGLDSNLEAPQSGSLSYFTLFFLLALLGGYVYRLHRTGRVDVLLLARVCGEWSAAAGRHTWWRLSRSGGAADSYIEREKIAQQPPSTVAVDVGPVDGVIDAPLGAPPAPQIFGLSPGESPLLSADDIRRICQHLPSRCIGKSWQLLFSTDQHGYSLQTLYSRVRHRGPSLVVVMDDASHVMAGFASRDFSGSNDSNAYLSSSSSPGRPAHSYTAAIAAHLPHSLHSHAHQQQGQQQRGFFGSGESFVASIRPDFAVYRWTRQNNLFLLARPDCLAFGGGGGGFGLSLDSALERGVSGHSETYGNPPLAAAEVFRVIRVEVWGFVLNVGRGSPPGRSSGGGGGAGGSVGDGGGGGGGSANLGVTTKDALLKAALALKGVVMSRLTPAVGQPSVFAGSGGLIAADSGLQEPGP